MMDIQAKLDEWLASNPEAQKYVSKLYHVPDNQPVPTDATHVLRFGSAQASERALRIAAVCVPEFAVFLDMLLAMIATQPGTGPVSGPQPTKR